ncbi:hypothetical protein [Ruegeria atlantica]|uniref:hypothetical protein n=1 Tax=Ruegeria atlantica TaxID=81569 RepID=UPI00147FFD52|nr:hypothetical protein [Ruegeria atlantica]
MRRSVGAPARLCQAGVGYYSSVLLADTGIAGGLDGARVRRAAVVAASAFAGAGFSVTGLAAGLAVAGFTAGLTATFGASALAANCGFAVGAACALDAAVFAATGFGFGADVLLTTAGLAAVLSEALAATEAVLVAVCLGDSTLGFAIAFLRATGLGLVAAAGLTLATGLVLGATFAEDATGFGAEADACRALTDTNGSSIAERVKICIIFIWFLTA